MAVFEHFFIDAVSAGGHHLAVHGSYHPGLVALSLIVSIFSATMALHTGKLALRANNRLHRNVAVSTGSFALGGGIWAMHFIGMLSFELPTHVDYQTALTLLSILPAWGASWLALHMLSRQEISRLQLATSGALIGLGIGAMHYSGMAAMHTPLQMRYEPLTFFFSIVVAIVLATVSLWVRYRLRQTRLSGLQRLLISGVVMGLAIAGMHYIGMTAVRFSGQAGTAEVAIAFNPVFVSIALSTFTVTVTVLVSALNGLVRSRDLYRQVEESQSRLHAILDTAVDVIITIDSRGLIQSANRSVERMFGWTPEELVGRNVSMLMPEPDRSQHDGYLHNYQSSGVAKIIGTGREVTAQRRDGSLMPMRLAVGRVDLADELLFVGFITDITDRHALEASLRETAERAEQAAAAKGFFLANMSHEIRTPMNAVIGFTELLLQGELNPTQRSHLNTVRQSARSLLGLLNDILDSTRLEKGGMMLETIDFSLRELAWQIAASLRLGAQAKNLDLTVDYPQDMNEFFQGDPLRIQQILTNLLGNAIKFTEHGRVELIFREDDGQVHIQVCDTGIGMSQEQISSIFTPFTQADASISRRFGGTGLGTTIARQLIELMDGSIEIESRPGEGSIFHVRLPLPTGDRPTLAPADDGSRALPQLTVLVADDVPQNLELVRLMLEKGGHRVHTVGDGNEALKTYMAERFDLILMDVHMPVSDGLQTTRRIRQFERERNRHPTPIIALTASVMSEDRSAARNAGMNGFAVKPLDESRLMAEVARVLAGGSLHTVETLAGGASAGPEAVTLIDWTTGISLWGSQARLVKSLRAFLGEVGERYPLPEPRQANVNWLQTLFSLHSIRGAAGNLALPGVAALAGELERQVKADGHEGVLAEIARLRDMLGAVAQELRAYSVQEEVPANDAGTAALGSEALLAQLHELLACLARNELNPQVLEAVCDALGQDGEALRSAVDAFEFQQAHTLLERVIVARTDTEGSRELV
ncbi:MHYT domain-containing protein [Stutzerimonas kirkiae]|uniref:Sensor protein FixL n=1 Tax=Stutzerimonas kirkiae TaxID=2211392 RepID=A0A4Q9REN6_9GAMM|nr:MHYT domain-containing protein [Stutzerimonas kirkiae]TBV00071.1 response regulator receiver protein [Stutzerimonas kirkiae]TBV05777.1 response regulator receiver protein [Stutzerimonas kirkiae]TBV09572.1 response regulator receiver protein [Stutzerimonas kirkiae]TBV17346.1 response regulator receiver protein [Stutzerimonas kirkiae]